MGESQNLNINLDIKSIDILRKVDAIHRDSLINVGLALVEKTGYFKTLAGLNDSAELEEIASFNVKLDIGDNEKINKKTEEIKSVNKKPTSNWDSF